MTSADEKRKSAFADSSLLLTFTLDVMHQWRLAALFVISGMGTAFAFRRRTWQAYLLRKAARVYSFLCCS
jgi:hypothetical protein